MAHVQTGARTHQQGARTDRPNGVIITESAYQHGFLWIHRLYWLRFQTIIGVTALSVTVFTKPLPKAKALSVGYSLHKESLKGQLGTV